MNKRFFRLAALVMLTAVWTSGNAQSLLENLTFEAPKQMVRPNGASINVRTKPSKSAPKVKWPDSPWDLTISKNEVYNAQSENAAWYNIGIGWISKSAARKVTSAPITDKMLNRFFGWSDGYDLWQEYLVSKTKSKYDLMVYYTQSDRQNKLYLGKQVGNVLVFKYSVVFTIEVADNEAPNYMNLAAEDRDGTKYYTLTIGSNYVQQVVQGGMGMTKTLDFSKLNDKVLERIFQEVIKSNRTDYLYINSLLLSGAYANYMLG